MRKLLAFIFWIFTTALYALNIMFLVYLIGRTFNLAFLGDFMGWFSGIILQIKPDFSLPDQDLGFLWLAYLIVCTPIVALMQVYGKNLGNSSVSFPLLKTLFSILGAILKLVLILAALGAICYFVFNKILV